MLLQIFAPVPAQALSMGESGKVQKSEGQRINDRSEVFTFNNTEKPKMSWFSRGTQSTYGARNASLTRTENLKITTEATGLDEGQKPFNWKAFGDNQKFTAWIEVSYIGEKDENGRPKKYKVSGDIEINKAETIETQVEVDAQKTVDKYYLRTEYQDSPNAFKIKAFFSGAPQLSPKGGTELVFSLDIYQIVSTEIEYNLIDEYGKAIDLKEDKEEKPLLKDLKEIGKFGNDVTFDLKNTGKEILWQEQGLDEWDLTDSSLAMTLTKDKITSIDIEYKLTSTYDVLKGGKVTIQRQKDAVTPKDPKNPGNIPDGYARINLSADALGGKTDGTFTKDDPKDTQRVVDVKAGKAYTTAQAEVEKQGKPFPLTSEKKEDTGKTFDKWTPELSTLGTAADKETKTLNATYKSSDKDIIPYLPGEEVPTKDKDGLPIPMNYLTVTFKSEDAKKGNVRIVDKEGATVFAKVKPGVDLSTKEEISTRPAKDYGFTKWDPKLGVPQVGSVYTAHFIKSGSKINENDPIPEGWARVSVSQDDASIKAGTVKKAFYTVKPGDKLAKEAFVDISKAANEGYKDPAWYVGTEKVAAPENHVIYGPTDFIAKATQKAADKITKNGGLKAVDITAYKGDSTDGKFWNKGVALKNADAELQKLLDEATVADESGRTTAEAGEKVGTLKVTFKDGSTLEVENQKLIVKDTKVDINFDKEANDDANAPRHKETIVKGKVEAAKGVNVKGAEVIIKDANDKELGKRLANEDGTFVVETNRKLQAGEKLKIEVTLPGTKESSPAVEKIVKLNPDQLNKIITTGDKLSDNIKDDTSIEKAKRDELKAAVDEGYTLVNKAQKPEDQINQKAIATTDSKEEQDKLDASYERIKAAIEAITGNKLPRITGPEYREIFVGEDHKLDNVAINIKATAEETVEKGYIIISDGDNVKGSTDPAVEEKIDLVKYSDDKYYQLSAKKQKVDVSTKAISWETVDKDNIPNINNTPGTYEVTYTAKDKSGAEATHTMTVVVKEIKVTKIEVTKDPTKTDYLAKTDTTEVTPNYSGLAVKLTKNNGEVVEATYDNDTNKWMTSDQKEVNDLSIAPEKATAKEGPKTIIVKHADGPEAPASKPIIVQVDSDENGKADNEENFDITKAKTMEITNQPILNYELDHKTGKATLDLKPLVVKVTDSLGNFKYFGYEEIKGDNKFALALGTDSFDKNKAKELSTADTDKKVKVTLTYKENKTLEAETSAIKVEDKRPNVIENPTPGETREGYVSVKFNAGKNGGLKGVNTFLVKKDTAKSEVTVPTIVPAAGYKVKTANGGWDKAIPATFATDFEATAQYELDDTTSDTPKPGYTPITFDALDKGKIGTERTKTIYVNPAADVKLSEKAPTVTANTGYSFKAWDPAIDTAKKYTKEERILATYTSDELISDKEKAGYIKVTFAKGDHGKFNVTDPAQKTDYWVKPDTLVDLREKAPKLTADAGYIHTGWSQDLVVNYPANSEAQTITAQYELDSDYSTTEKAGYTKITFDKGANGEFAKGAKTELWVNPAKELTLPAPGIVPHPGYSHTGWTKDNAAVDLNKKAKYDKATTITAAYESDISETEKTGYVKVSFDADKNGKIADTVKKDFWVNPNKEVNLIDKAPTVTPNSGYLFINWDHKLVDTFKTETTIKATYASAGDIKTEQTDGFAHVKFNAGKHGSFATGATVEYWVNPEKPVVLPEPRVIAKDGYEHKGWDPEITPAKKYSKDKETTITATYTKLISTEKVDGHQEIKFLAGDDGTFADGKKEISIWVKPDTLVDLRKSAPEVTVTTEGKTFTGWDKDLVGSFAKSDQATEIKAKYAGSTSETPVPGWTEITFKSGDHGRFGNLNNTPIVEKKLWVDPKADVKLSDKAPKTIDDKNWSFDKWMDGQNPATGLDVAGKYTEAKTYTASYKSDISTTPQEGFVKITFDAGNDGSFEQGAVIETYVRKDKEVDIADKAPKVTPNKGLSLKGWAIDNVTADLTKIKVSTDTTITAKYTDSTSETPVEGWTEITFKAGEHGNFGKDGTTPVVEKKLWVDPKSEVKLSDKAPKVTPNTNWLFDKWMDGNAEATLSTSAMYTEKKTFTATYKSVFSDKQEEDNVLITFKPGDNGRFEDRAKTTVYVHKNVEVDLREKAPVVIPDQNYGHKGWKINNEVKDLSKVSFKEATDVVAYYVNGTFKADELASIDVFGPTKLSYAEDEKLDLAGLKIVVKDKAGIQKTYEGAEAITAAGFTIAPADKTALKIATHNGKPITVSKTIGQNTEPIVGKTVSTLSVSKNKSAEPTEVLARNLGKDPQKTTVTGKAPEGSVIKVTDIDGKDLTDGTEVKVGKDGEFTVTLKDKLAPGTPVKVTSTEPGKTESSPVVKQVFDDENEDGIDDKTQKTPTPTIEFAANQNTAKSDGTGASETEKNFTTVKFTVKNKPTTVYVRYTVNGKAKEETFEIGANEDATKTVDLKVKLPIGADVEVLAKDADKLISDAASAKVVRDSNNDGKDDGKKALGEPVIEDIKAGSNSITVTPPEGATKLVISETDKDGKTPQDSTPITVTKGKDGNWKIGDTPVEKTEDGKLIIPNPEDDKKLKLDEYNVVKVDAEGDKDTTTPSKAVKTVGKAKDTEAPAKPKVDQPVDGDENIKVKTPTEPDAKTITVEVSRPAKPAGPGEEPGEPTVEKIVVTKGEDGNWKTPNGEKVPEVNGKLEIPVEINKPLKTGDDVKVTTTDNDDNNSVPYTEKVVAKIKMDKPEINPIKTGDRTVEGTALTNKGKPDQFAASTVDIHKYQPPTEEGKEGTWTLIAKDVAVDQDTGAYKYNHDQGFKDGDKIRVVAKKPGAEDSFNEITAGVDTTALDKAIKDGKDALDPNKGGKNNGTPEDKALEDAIKKGEDLKKQDPAPTQEEVDKAQKDIEKAIKDKKDADEARDKLQEKINEANDKKNDPDYDSKPENVKDELDDSAKDGQTVHDDKTKNKEDIDKAIEKIQEKLDQYNKQQIGLNISNPVIGRYVLDITATVTGAYIEVKYRGKIIGTGYVDGTGSANIELSKKLEYGDVLYVTASHDLYLSRTNRTSVR